MLIYFFNNWALTVSDSQGKKPAPAVAPAPSAHDGSYTETFESGAASAQEKTDDNVSSIGEDEKKREPVEAKSGK